ncbi:MULTISPECIES: MotE family protein [unclassified Nitratireductor]|uniref:MotE family protein n=1 Tax=unclassified Nitratireductor TaxID=2641084 RepID=UPI0026013949|nr:MotE family protein [Nitratireductor sp.]
MSRSLRLKKISTAVFAGLVVATQIAPLHALAAENPATMKPDEVERFCANIADAARDRRYALQAMELEKLKGEVDERIAALEQKRADYEGWLQRRNVFLAQAEAGIVEIYASMRPDAAAERLAEVRVELAAAILMKLEPRTAGIILNEMNSKSAATLTTIIASAARPEDPT